MIDPVRKDVLRFASLSDSAETLTLLSPLRLAERYTEPSALRVLAELQVAFQGSPTRVGANLDALQLSLSAVSTSDLPADFETGTALTRGAALELDRYMRVRHVTSDSPGTVLLASLISACRAFYALAPGAKVESVELERLALGFSAQHALLTRALGGSELAAHVPLPEAQAPREPATEDLLEIWRRGHWLFFVLTQGLTLALKRFAGALREHHLEPARVELRAASHLLWASGASMKLAGSFSDAQYHATVRPSMTHGDPAALVEHSSLSGTMTWDHHYLVSRVWRQELLPLLPDLSDTLREDYDAFLLAYRAGLAAGHRAVCSKFGGDTMGSLVAPHQIATEILDKIEARRLTQLSVSRAAKD
jgi:hypothetical protein